MCPEFRDSQAKGLVSFRVGGAGTGAGAVVGKEVGTAAAGGDCERGEGFLTGDSLTAGGDHGIEGRALVILLSESVLEGSFSVGALLGPDEMIYVSKALRNEVAA